MDAHWSLKQIVPWGHNRAGSVEDIMSSLSVHQVIIAACVYLSSKELLCAMEMIKVWRSLCGDVRVPG